MKKAIQDSKNFVNYEVWLPAKHWVISKFNKDPLGQVLDVQVSPFPNCVTVVLGKLDKEGKLIPDYRKYICVQLPAGLHMEHKYMEKAIKYHPETRLKF